MTAAVSALFGNQHLWLPLCNDSGARLRGPAASLTRLWPLVTTTSNASAASAYRPSDIRSMPTLNCPRALLAFSSNRLSALAVSPCTA